MEHVSSAELAKLVNTASSATKHGETGDAAEEARAIEVLKVLKRTHVTAALLKETEAGKRIAKLTKSNLAKVAEAANAVVLAWKDMVKKDQEHRTISDSKASDKGKERSEHVKSKPAYQSGRVPELTRDPVRDKTRKLLLEALEPGAADIPEADPCRIAVEIETAMFRASGDDVNNQYKSKYRTLAANLKDVNNPGLRHKLLSEDLTAEELVQLSPEELASEDKRQKKKDILEKMARECVRGQTTQASTDQFQCSKCKQRKTTYYQMQTRSADEPMTTFVSCVVCGNKWKFC